jgi:hypothetical protein
MLTVIMLSVAIYLLLLNVIMPSAVIMSVVMLNGIIMSVVRHDRNPSKSKILSHLKIFYSHLTSRLLIVNTM